MVVNLKCLGELSSVADYVPVVLALYQPMTEICDCNKDEKRKSFFPKYKDQETIVQVMQVQSIFLIMKDQIGRLNNISHCNCLAKLPQELQEQLKTLFS
ncbi:hypothetical protein PRUPE_1G511700 [Prunus persica]|uniref:Uncharacterized protein n=1 Tax=Prunus persica TaxID=3760 RepID=A0A251RG53_PRUPE|nr:hypothetical protein PRUPE_1G511700 [Prunus persica]